MCYNTVMSMFSDLINGTRERIAKIRGVGGKTVTKTKETKRTLTIEPDKKITTKRTTKTTSK